jgi:hypothetical protein
MVPNKAFSSGVQGTPLRESFSACTVSSLGLIGWKKEEHAAGHCTTNFVSRGRKARPLRNQLPGGTSRAGRNFIMDFAALEIRLRNSEVNF